jgi:uncharacterized phage-associated protein
LRGASCAGEQENFALIEHEPCYYRFPFEADMPPYSAAAIANWFLDRAERGRVSIDPMKLQKLIYFAYGWYLALTNRPLITEHPEAWDYGPVIPSIYHEFKNFGRDPITRRILKFDSSVGRASVKDLLNTKLVSPKIEPNDTDTQNFLERIWEVYGSLTGVQLSNMTHATNGAWHKSREQAHGRQGFDIPDDLIKEEFVEKSKRAA